MNNADKDYDRYIKALATKLGGSLQGEHPRDAVTACAVIMAYTLKDVPEREAALQRMFDFIKDCWTEDEQAR